MTKNKARKAAARARAASTGERYVVARRAVELTSDARIDGVWHRLTHRMPGIPRHVDGGLAARHDRRHRRFARRSGHQGSPAHGEPRVLAGWQHRIARLVGAE